MWIKFLLDFDSKYRSFVNPCLIRLFPNSRTGPSRCLPNAKWSRIMDDFLMYIACILHVLAAGRSMDATRSLFLRESGELMFRCLPMALNEITRLVQVYNTWSLEHIYPLKQTGSGCCMNWCYSVKLVGDCCCIVGLAVRIIVSDELITRSQCPYPDCGWKGLG